MTFSVLYYTLPNLQNIFHTKGSIFNQQWSGFTPKCFKTHLRLHKFRCKSSIQMTTERRWSIKDLNSTQMFQGISMLTPWTPILQCNGHQVWLIYFVLHFDKLTRIVAFSNIFVTMWLDLFYDINQWFSKIISNPLHEGKPKIVLS